ncbi:MAG: mucoidy inhibitor MuiA family protein [Deltaproteobacteria bacterium]|nr:mucoidy inhibitor MuiA family protein [Deltaproteobacteria bacterium]
MLLTFPLLLTLSQPPAADVTKVVVYPDRAQVTREARIACGPRAVANFAGITPSADPASFRARTNLGAIEGLRTEVRTRDQVFAPDVKAIDVDVRRLRGETAALENRALRAGEQATLAGRLLEVARGLVGREMNDATPNAAAWTVAFETALATRLKANAAVVDVQSRRRDLDRKLAELYAKRSRLATAATRREHFAEVLVSCAAGRSATVELTYMVGGAGWRPSYEARADEKGGTVDLATFATITQSTGEPWTKTRVTLSTAVPRENATPPDVRRLNIWAEERKATKKVLVRRDEFRDRAEASGKDDAVSGDTQMQVAAQGLSVQLTVPERADIAGNGTPARLFVARTKMKARFALRSIPKLMPFVFRVADLSNAAPFPLLAGPIDAFRHGALMARYQLPRVPQGGRFHLTFGLEESIRMKRVTVEELRRDEGLFKSNRRFRYVYRFDVASFSKSEAEVELSEHIPVSELDDVKVGIDTEVTTAGYEHRADDGIVTWRLKMGAGEKRSVTLAFIVDVPSSFDSGRL